MKIKRGKRGDMPVQHVSDDLRLITDQPMYGLTIREHIAIEAMKGLLSGNPLELDGANYQYCSENLAVVSCVIADAMLKELDK